MLGNVCVLLGLDGMICVWLLSPLALKRGSFQFFLVDFQSDDLATVDS